VYAKRKLKTQERNRFQRALDDMSFSCGAALQDAEIPTEVADVVYVKKMHCHKPIERLYYAADFNDICVHCGATFFLGRTKNPITPSERTVLRSPRSQMPKTVNYLCIVFTVFRVTVTVCVVKVVYCKLCGCSTSLKYLLKCEFPATLNLVA